MGSLKEFLAEQAERLQVEEDRAVQKRDEWLEAVGRLNQQIRGWLEQADPDHLLEVSERSYPLREVGIGAYEALGLLVRLGLREVRVEPVARNVAGPLSAAGVLFIPHAYGRVDLANRLEKYLIFRVEKTPEERWNIVEQDGFRIQPFDQSTFEEAFRGLLE